MASSVVYTCDHCGAQKRTANHWFVLTIEPHRLEVRPWAAVDSTPGARHRTYQGLAVARAGKRVERREDPESRLDKWFNL